MLGRSSLADPHEQALAPPPPRQESSSTRWLIGCGLGCAGLLALALGAVVVGVLWLVLPPEQIPSDALVGPESLAVVRLEDLASDPGLTQALSALEHAARAAAEDSGRRALALPFTRLRAFVPREATAVLERGPQGARACLAINLRSFARPLRAMLAALEDPERWSREERHGVALRVFRGPGESFALGFVEGTLLVARDLDALEPVLARIERWRASGESEARLPADFPPEQEAWDVRLWAGAAPGELERVLAPWLDDALGRPRDASGARAPWSEALSGVLSLRGGADLVDAARVRWQVRLELDDPRAAERLRERAEEQLRAWEREAREHGHELRWSSAASGRGLSFEGELSGAESLWVELLGR